MRRRAFSMTAPRAILPLLSVAVIAASGCRLFDAGVFGEFDRGEDRTLAALRNQLRKDAWRRNPEWSLIRGTESDAALNELAGRSRWNYDGRLATALIDRLDKQREYVQPIAKRPWRTADKHLLEIARDDNLAGWNALILIGQRAPEFARPLEHRLRELVKNPLRYDAETGERVSSAKVTASKAGGSGKNEKPGAESGSRQTALSGLSIDQLLELARDEQPPATTDSDRGLWDELLAKLPSTKPSVEKTASRKTRTVSAAMRAAAAEAWCRVLAADQSDPIDGLAPAGRLLQRGQTPQGVQRELTLGIARRVPPAVIPRVEKTVRPAGTTGSEPDETAARNRRTVAEACVVHAIHRRCDQLNDDLASSAPPPRRAPLRKASESRLNGSGSRLNEGIWPDDIHVLREDPDPDVRILYGRWAALSGIDNALAILDVQSRLSIDKPVRRAAVVSIGLLGTEDASRLLRDVAKSGDVPMRIAAIKALARWGARGLVPFLEDESPAVRQAVAESLQRRKAESGKRKAKEDGAVTTHHSPLTTHHAATLAERLLKDRSLAVQTACLDAIVNWPDRQAVPLLLQAMRSAPATVAAKAWLALQERRPGLTGFTLRGDERERAEAVDQLVARFNLSTARTWPSLAEISALPIAEQQRLRNAVQRDVAVLVRATPWQKLPASGPNQQRPKLAASATENRYREAVDRLVSLGREATPYVDQEITQSLGSWPRAVYRTLQDDVLPKLDSAWAALRELEQSDSRARWNAVQKLAELGRQASLSPLVVKTLHERIADWRNRAVWQAAMQAVMKDSHPEADALAIAASQIPSPSVQALACEYFRRHPQSRFAGRILELMNSRDKSVRLAAIDAAGYCHQQRLIDGEGAWQKLPASVPNARQPKLAASATAARYGLRHWTTAADREVADAAVLSLARLGDEFGYRQLHLMSHAEDPKRRRRAYEMMGKTGRAQFLSRLIERGRKEPSGELKKAILQSLQELTAPDERPVGLSQISGYHEQIGAWQERVECRRSKSRRGNVRITE